MKTKKQQELIDSFLAALDEVRRPIYQDIAMYLSALGYYPQKERTNLSFKHDLHNKQMAKMGIKNNKEHSPFFALRFSACKGYSQRFADIVREVIVKNPSKAPRCTSNGCNYCGGEADTHVYTQPFPDGGRKSHCGAYALEIPGITADDIEEIKSLINEEHEYLLKHEGAQPLVKIGDFTVCLRTEKPVRSVTLLPDETPVEFGYNGGVLEFKVKDIDMIRMYRIDN